MTEKKYYPYLLFFINFLSVALGAMNSVLSSAYLPEIVKGMRLNINTEDAGAWINFAFLAGGTVGGITLGFVSDQVGRKNTLVMALLFCGIGSGLGIITTAWQAFAFTRFIVGIGVGAALVTSAVIFSESWRSRTKAILLGILSVAYPVGIIASGIITSSIADWKIAFAIGVAPAFLALPAYYLVTETFPSEKRATTHEIIREGYGYNLMMGIIVYGTMLIGLWSAFAWMPVWVQSLLGDASETGQSQRGMSLTLLGVGGLAGGIISGWLVNRWGAKLMQAMCFVLCFILSLLLFKLTKTFSVQVLIGSSLLGFCFGVSQGVLNAYIPDLFPVKVRSSGTGLCFHAGRAFTAVAVFFVGVWALQLGGYGNAIFLFSGIYLVGLIALLFIKKSS